MPEQVGRIRVSNFGGTDLISSPWSIDPRDSPLNKNVIVEDASIRRRPAVRRRYTAAFPTYIEATNESTNSTQAAFIWQTSRSGQTLTRYFQDWNTFALGDIAGVADQGQTWTKISGGANGHIDNQSAFIYSGRGIRFIVDSGNESDVRYRRSIDGNSYNQYRLTFIVKFPSGLDDDWHMEVAMAKGDSGSVDSANVDQAIVIGISRVSSTTARVEIRDNAGTTVIKNPDGSDYLLNADTGYDFNADVGRFALDRWNLFIIGQSFNDVATYLGVVTSGNGTVDRLILGGKDTTGPDSLGIWDHIRINASVTASDSTKIFVVQGGKGATIPRLLQGEALDPATPWTVVADVASDADVRVHPVLFREFFIFPQVPAAAPPKKLDVNGAVTDLGGTPPKMSDCIPFNRILWAARTDGQVQFSGIGTAESWRPSDTINIGDQLFIVSGLWNFGQFLSVLTETGIYGISGFGRTTVRIDELSLDVGSSDQHAIAGSTVEAYFLGHSVFRRTIVMPRFNPYERIYRITASGVIDDISEKIRNAEIFKSNDEWAGDRTDVHLAYDDTLKRLYVLAPRYNPGSIGTSGERLLVRASNGEWFEWSFASNQGISWIYTRGLGQTAASPAGTGPVTLLGGSGVSGMRHVFFWDEGYRGNAAPAAAKDVDVDGNQTVNINAFWRTPAYRIFDEDQSDDIVFLYIWGKQISGTNLKVEYRVDQEIDDDAAFRIAGDTGAGTETHPLQVHGKRIDIGEKCRMIQFQFTFGVDAVEPQIDGWIIGYEPAEGLE